MSRFPAFDHQRRPQVEVIEGVPTIIRDRELIAELDVIEVLDERTDQWVSLPIRSVWTAGAGISVELGPFSLLPSDVARLNYALIEHMRSADTQTIEGES